MGDWLAENWMWFLAAACYVVGRAAGVPAVWRAIARAGLEAIEAHSLVGVNGARDPTTDSIKKTVEAKIGRDLGVLKDALASSGDVKHARKPWVKVVDAVTDFLPVVGTLKKLFQR